MTGRRTLATLLAGTLAVLLLAAPGAGAKPGYFVIPGSRGVDLDLQGSHGYRIEISEQAGYVNAFVTKGLGSTSYSTPSLGAKGDGIRARFPGLGRVSVRFRPQGPPRQIPPEAFPGCRGGEIIRQHGHFVGTIRFRGERGYTSVRASRVRGTIETTAKEVCKRSPSDNDPEPVNRTELWAHSRSGNQAVGFDAFVLGDPLDLTSFGAMVAERRRGMRIFRWITVTGEQGDVIPGDTRPHPLSATIAPPAPFSGSGRYERTPEGERTWTGSLAVTLPGLGRIRLAGPRFSALLCQLSGCSDGLIDGHALPLIAPDHGRLRAP